MITKKYSKNRTKSPLRPSHVTFRGLIFLVVTTLYIRHILHQSPKNNFDIENNSTHDQFHLSDKFCRFIDFFDALSISMSSSAMSNSHKREIEPSMKKDNLICPLVFKSC